MLHRFFDHVAVVVTVHGYGRAGMWTSLLLGGSNRALASAVAAELVPALPEYEIVTDLDTIPRDLRGLHPGNPVNVPGQGGVQLELPPRVRGLTPHWADWDGPELVPPAAAVVEALTRVAVGVAAAVRRRAGALVVAAAIALVAPGGCSSGDDDTLQPLPAEGPAPSSTVGTSATTTAPGVGTTAPGPSRPASSTTTSTSTTVADRAPSGDWDGVRFDVGTIDTVSEIDGYQAIGLDRYSLNDPQLGTLDATSFETEPVRAWWQENPFANIRVNVRTFVVDPDVEVLVLDESGRAASCTTPPPSTPPTPRWRPADVSLLADPARSGGLAVLTYSDSGQVVRIRFTHGC